MFDLQVRTPNASLSSRAQPLQDWPAYPWPGPERCSETRRSCVAWFYIGPSWNGASFIRPCDLSWSWFFDHFSAYSHVGVRIRHVKCDEGKPCCLKCRSTGRICDGYAREGQKSLIARSRSRTPPYQSPYQSLSIATEIDTGYFGTELERRSFDFFHHQIGQNLSEALQLNVVHQLILQLSHSNGVVKHAVIAVGSLGGRLRRDGTIGPIPKRAESDEDFHQLQYGKAIQKLRSYLYDSKDRSTELVLISCFLFAVFEFLQGSDATSAAHLRAGFKILRCCFASDVAAIVPIVREPSPNANVLLHELIHTFSILDVSTFFVSFPLPSACKNPRRETFLRSFCPTFTPKTCTEGLGISCNTETDLEKRFTAASGSVSHPISLHP